MTRLPIPAAPSEVIVMNSHLQPGQQKIEPAGAFAQADCDRSGQGRRVVDPVCFMRVLASSPYRLEHDGVTYRFCGERCLHKFHQDPDWYLPSAGRRKPAGNASPAPDARDEPIFAVRSAIAGGARDPVCHMTVSLDSPHQLEHAGRRYRFCTARCLEKFRAWPVRYVRQDERRERGSAGLTPDAAARLAGAPGEDQRGERQPITGGRAMNVKDPVCGMQVDDKKAAASLSYQGQTYYFCCEGCQRRFEKNPEAHLKGGAGEGHHGHHH